MSPEPLTPRDVKLPGDLYSSAEAMTATGVSYRQLDYWVRVGAVLPETAARGPGSKRRFTHEQVAQLAACRTLADLGAPLGAMAALRQALDEHPGLWKVPVMVSRSGEVVAWPALRPINGACWLVDLPRVAASVQYDPPAVAV